MMNEPSEITVTLHWRGEGGEMRVDAALSNSAPANLIPVLVEGCGLPEYDQQHRPIAYELRHGGPTRLPLDADCPLSEQGVHTGDHLWLVVAPSQGARGVRWVAPPTTLQRRCILHLPDGTQLLVPQQGLAMTRDWLIQILRLYAPASYKHEQGLGGSSAYMFVSNKLAHCTLTRRTDGTWTISTTRDDVETEIHGIKLRAHQPETLQEHDQLRLGGAKGLTVKVELV